VPALDEGDFERLTLTAQMALIERLAAGDPINILGSSMGGYLAALYAARHPEVQRVVLLAPAFRMAERWEDRLGPVAMAEWRDKGSMPVFHYGEQKERFLRPALIDDAHGFEGFPEVSQPTLIFHGQQDDIVPVGDSIAFAASRPHVELQILESDHELGNVLEIIGRHTLAFLSEA
jgi:pimeloyl-ACP methyl ester carboxylesterase